jgi:hypothetical protein
MTYRTASPDTLQAPEQALWDAITREFDLGDASGRALLQAALEARQRARECRELIDRDGLLLDGKPHPLLVAERDARKAFAAIMRQLDLEPGTQRPVGRPPRPVGASLEAIRGAA